MRDDTGSGTTARRAERIQPRPTEGAAGRHGDRDGSRHGCLRKRVGLAGWANGAQERDRTIRLRPSGYAGTSLRADRSYGSTELNGAQGRDRTTDTAIFSRMLYQLSYLGKPAGPKRPKRAGGL